MSNFINDNVVIDFDIPSLLQGLFDEAKVADSKNNPEYSGIADSIDVCCKGLVANGVLTQSQWDLICHKYPII